MKKLLTLIFISYGGMLMAQQNANVINFEPGTFNPNSCPTYAAVEGNQVPNWYFDCAYGIQFFSAPPNQGPFNNSPNAPQPEIVEVGGTNPGVDGIGFLAGTIGNPWTSPSGGCTVPITPPNVDGYDTPADGLDFGCFFLTAATQYRDNQNQLNSLSFYVQYSQPNTSASGVLMDVDGSESWDIIAKDATGASVMLNNYNINTSTPGSGNRGAITWSIDPSMTGGNSFVVIEFKYVGGGGAGVAFDEFSPFSAAEATTTSCCDEAEELIVNGGMENGGPPTLQVNGYTFNGNVGPNSVMPGQWTIVNANRASIISPTWNLLNASNCGDGNVMIVNGKTCDGYDFGPENVVELSNIEVEEGETYSFCFSYKHLKQCSFDYFHDGLVIGRVDGVYDLEEMSCGDDANCGWKRRKYKFVAPSNLVTLYLTMASSMPGDGNDVAFDDISLVKLEEPDALVHQFKLDIPFTYIGGNQFNIKATSLSPTPANIEAEWKVQQITSSVPPYSPVLGTVVQAGAPNWGPDLTWFNGYPSGAFALNPRGVFIGGNSYRISRITDGCCVKEKEWGISFTVDESTRLGKKTAKVQMIEDGSDEIQEFIIPLDGSTGIDEYANELNADIYPNPGQGIVNVETTYSIKGGTIQIFNSAGELVQRIDNVENDNLNSIDLSAENAGVYLISIMDASGNLTGKTYVKE